MQEFSPERFYDLRTPAARVSALKDGIELCYEHRKDVAVLCLIACGLDALAGKNAKKRGYVRFLGTHFPEFCREFDPKDFYVKYRNGLVHEMIPDSGFAITRAGVDGPYVSQGSYRGRLVKVLNIERLKVEFVKLVEAWPWEDKGNGNPAEP